MKTKPKLFDFLAGFYLTVALSFPVQIMLLYGHTPLQIMQIWNKLTNLNLTVMGCCLLNAVLSRSASPLLKFSVPLSLLAVFVNNNYVALMEVNYSAFQAHGATFGFFLVSGFYLYPKLLYALMFPETHWWKVSPRKQIEVTALISPFQQGHPIKAKTFDLSETGAFFNMSEEQMGFKVNDRLIVLLTLGSLSQIRCEARIVRSDDKRGHYPSGVGISFVDLDRSQRRKIKNYLENT